MSSIRTGVRDLLVVLGQCVGEFGVRSFDIAHGVVQETSEIGAFRLIAQI